MANFFLNLKNPFVGFASPLFFGRQDTKIHPKKIKNTDNHPFFPSSCMKTASAIRLVSEITRTKVGFFFLSPEKTQNRQLSDSQLY
jgi:hypothetical protein